MKDENSSKSNKKLSGWKFLFAAGLFVLLIFAVCLYAILTQEPKLDAASEKIIRTKVARDLYRGPDELTDEDYANITAFTLLPGDVNPKTYHGPIFLSDISLLKKFKNLEILHLTSIYYPKDIVPKWMKILAKFGIIDLNKRFALDLSPIGTLSKLKELELIDSQVSDLEPIKGLKNLESLCLTASQVSDLKPIKELTNLKRLSINETQVSDLEPIKYLVNLQSLGIGGIKISNLEPITKLKKLEGLSLTGAEISDLRPIKELTNLKVLLLNYTNITDIELLKDLKNLKTLNINGNRNITDKQIEELQKALPELEIRR